MKHEPVGHIAPDEGSGLPKANTKAYRNSDSNGSSGGGDNVSKTASPLPPVSICPNCNNSRIGVADAFGKHRPCTLCRLPEYEASFYPAMNTPPVKHPLDRLPLFKLDDLRRILSAFRRLKTGIEVECTSCGDVQYVDVEEMYSSDPDKTIEELLYVLEAR